MISPALAGLFQKMKSAREILIGELRKPEVREAGSAAAELVRRVGTLPQVYAAAAQDGQDAAASERVAAELAEVRRGWRCTGCVHGRVHEAHRDGA